MTAAVFADFFVATVPGWEIKNAPLLPVIVGKLVQGEPVRDAQYGHYGYRGKQSFVGTNSRGDLLFQATGSWAAATARVFASFVQEQEVSVARFDLQATVNVDNADRIVTTIRPNRRYKAHIYAQLFESGATLYIGAPSSDRRLRVYNKSAESEQYPELGEWLRVELQTRNRYADRLWRAYLRGAGEGNFLEAVRAMADENLYRLLRDSGFDPDAPVFDCDYHEHDWAERRISWLAHTVVPALRKLVLHSEDAREAVRLAFENILSYNNQPKGKTDAESGVSGGKEDVCR